MQNTIDAITEEKNKLEEDFDTLLNQHSPPAFDACNYQPHPSHFNLDYFKVYFASMFTTFPFISFLMDLFLPISYLRKIRARATTAKWLKKAALIRTFIVDIYWKTRNPKFIPLTQLYLSIILISSGISNTGWRILQCLRIIVDKKTLKSYLLSYSFNLKSKASLIFYSLDNCDFYNHVTHVRGDNRSQIYHIVNHIIYECPENAILDTCFLYESPNRNDFGAWIQSSGHDVIQFTNQNYLHFTLGNTNAPLKYILSYTNISNIRKSQYIILTPELNISTAKTDDIIYLLDDFYAKYIQTAQRKFCFISGDQQTYSHLWKLRKAEPDYYGWLIPLPGEWHWTWHITKGIFKIFGKTFLLPFSKVLLFKNLDLEANNWHYAEDILEIITMAIFLWLKKYVPDVRDVVGFMHRCKRHKQLYEIIYLFVYYLVPYWITRSSIKYNMPDHLELWRYWIHLFIAANKYHYAIISLRHLWILKSLDPEVLASYFANRVYSSDGERGTGVALDAKLEMTNKQVKHLNTAGFFEKSLEWTAHSLNIIEPVMQEVHELLRKPKDEVGKFVNGTLADAQKLADFIESKLPKPNGTITSMVFKPKFWYMDPNVVADADVEQVAPSIKCEKSYAGLGRWYVAHQNQCDWESISEDNEVEVVETDEPSFFIDENEDPLDTSVDLATDDLDRF